MNSISMYMSSSEEERKIEMVKILKIHSKEISVAILLNCSLESFKIHDIF